VTTIFDSDQHLFPALRAGAQGYVLKDQSRPYLVQMLQAIAGGVPPLSPSIARRLLGFFSPPAAEPTPEALTPREIEVLTLLSKGLSIAAAADVLKLSRHTVGGYVKEIYRKLGVGTRAEAALEAARRGIVPIDS
jgi:DNA-binding NarL/FixJ family response regulator